MPTRKYLIIFSLDVLCDYQQHKVFRMAVQKRLALTIQPDYLDLLKKVADYQNIPVSTMVMGLLDAQRPVVEAMLKAFQDIEAGKDKQKSYLNF